MIKINSRQIDPGQKCAPDPGATVQADGDAQGVPIDVMEHVAGASFASKLISAGFASKLIVLASPHPHLPPGRATTQRTPAVDR